LHEEISKLPAEQRETIHNRFWLNMTLENCGKQARQHEEKALRKLRRNARLTNTYYSLGLRRIGLHSFKNTFTSSTEWAALKMLGEEQNSDIQSFSDE